MNAPLPLAWLQPSEDRPAQAAADPEWSRAPGARAAPSAPEAPDAPDAPGAPAAQRMLWHSRHGTIEIEVIGQTVYVNGQAVQPAPSAE